MEIALDSPHSAPRFLRNQLPPERVPEESPPPAADAVADLWAQRLCDTGKGDSAAFESIVQHWKTPLLHFFIRSGTITADAEELALQTLVQCYRAAPKYRPTRPFTSFLFTVARNALNSHLRKVACRPALAESLSPDSSHYPASPATEPRREWEELFETALANLPENQRAALLLYVQQELNYAEIAEILNLSQGAVKSAIHRARLAVKQFIEATDHENT